MEVYANINKDQWVLCIPDQEHPIWIEGGKEDDDPLRNQIKALLEMLCFLRKYSDQSYQIYINSPYCINCNEKWIPKWIERGFRIGHGEALRPNTDLLVQLYSFRRCIEFELFQHYDEYENYKTFIQV